MAEKKVGINLYSLREFTQTESDLTSTLRKVTGMGYQGVQISGIKGLEPEVIARLVRDANIPIAATHLSWEMFTEDVDRVIEIHKLYGCQDPAIGGLPKEYFSAEGATRFLDELGPVLERLASVGMRFSYHNHNHELAQYDGATWLRRVYEGSKAIPLNFEIDTYWITAGGGDPTAWIDRCEGKIPLLHCKDMAETPDREQQFAPVGHGNLEWDRIFPAAENSEVEWYLVEQDAYFGADPFESVAKSCEFLLSRLS